MRGSTIKGVGMTLAAGMIAGLVGTAAMRKHKGMRKIKKNAGRAVHAIGDFVDEVKYLMK